MKRNFLGNGYLALMVFYVWMEFLVTFLGLVYLWRAWLNSTAFEFQFQDYLWLLSSRSLDGKFQKLVY